MKVRHPKAKRRPLDALPGVIESLRSRGYKPYYHPKNGRLIDWRRIKNHKLDRVEVITHPSGRVCVRKSSKPE